MRGDVLKYFDVTFYSDTLQAFHTTTLHILCDETAETKFLSKGSDISTMDQKPKFKLT